MMVTVAVPVFVKVTTCASLVVPVMVAGKAMEVGETVSVPELPAVPVPLRATVCGEPGALSAALSVAVSAPAAAGLKATVRVQLAPAAIDVPQL